MEGYCEKHHQPWDIKCVNGQWVCECPKCRAEGLLDTYYDCKTTMLIEKELTVSNHTQNRKIGEQEMTLHEAVDFFNEDEISEKNPLNKSWKDSDMWKFTRDHNESEVEAWGGYIGKNDGFEPFGWMVDYENKEYYFGLDGHFINTKAK